MVCVVLTVVVEYCLLPTILFVDVYNRCYITVMCFYYVLRFVNAILAIIVVLWTPKFGAL